MAANEQIFSKEEVYGKTLDEFFSYIEKKIRGCENDIPLLHTKILEAKIEMLRENYLRLAKRNIHLTEREEQLALFLTSLIQKKREALQEHLAWIEKTKRQKEERNQKEGKSLPEESL